ncbi:MAG: signal peptidase I [Planctomycetes bacterium]|nr:signal peptidase I [Planctomycetota bacterium]
MNTKAKNDDKAGGFWRGSIESLVVAVVMALFIKQFALEAFEVPTESMEPTIIGRSSGGYRLIANKFVYQVREPRRWEVAIFQYPLNRLVNYVKRIVGMPDEWLFIRNGDVFTAPSDLDRDAALAAAKVQRKPKNVQDRLFDRSNCVPAQDRGLDKFRQYWTMGDGDRGTGTLQVRAEDEVVGFKSPNGLTLVDFQRPDRFRVRNGIETPVLSNRRFDDFSPVAEPRNEILLMLGFAGPSQGTGPQPGHEAEVGDLRLALEVRPEKDAWTVLEIRDGTMPKPIRLELATEGASEGSRLWLGDEEITVDARLEVDSWTEVRLTNVDDTVYVEVDGDVVLRKEYEHAPIAVVNPVRSESQTEPPPTPYEPPPVQPTHDLPYDNGVSFGCRSGGVEVREVELARDIYYSYSGATDFLIPEGHYLMLGDNSPDSLDGRGWERADMKYKTESGEVIVMSGDFQGVGAEGRHHEGPPEQRAIRPMKNPFDNDTRFLDVYGNTRTIDPDRIVRVPRPGNPEELVAVETHYDHFVPRQYIQGRAYVVFWPLLQIGLIR